MGGAGLSQERAPSLPRTRLLWVLLPLPCVCQGLWQAGGMGGVERSDVWALYRCPGQPGIL